MTTLLARVLLTLAFLVVASAQACTLCPDGKEPPNGDVFLFDDGIDLVTCTKLAKIFIASPAESCNDFLKHAYQVVCGCPGIKAGHCPGICNTGFILDQPNLIVSLFDLLTCSVVDQCFRGIPGDSNCDTNLAESGIKEVCMCKAKVTPSQNMGGDMGGNGGAGMGMMGMSGGRKLRISGLEERFPPRAARGLGM